MVWVWATAYMYIASGSLLIWIFATYSFILSADNLPPSGGDDAKATGSSGPDNEVPKGDAKTIGKNTLFAPRALVKPLGWTNKDEKKPDVAGELKSNEEFRNLLLKKWYQLAG
jgi:hypothetical protein